VHRILLVRLSSMGDVILTTPLLRAIRSRHPGAEITYLTRPGFASLVADHPASVEVLTFDPASESLESLAARLRVLPFTHLLDLHGVTRTRLLRLLVPGNWRGYSKRRLARWVLVHAKRDIYPDAVPEPERYFEAARDLDVVPDGLPAEVGIGTEAAGVAAAWLAEHGSVDARWCPSRPVRHTSPSAGPWRTGKTCAGAWWRRATTWRCSPAAISGRKGPRLPRQGVAPPHRPAERSACRLRRRC
jgi:hypothetical protein